MDARKSKIADIFNGNRQIQVPFYQRSYVWKEEQWERLLEDLKFTCQRRQSYFLGAIILKQKPTNTTSEVGDVRTVIDGQQRLTTLTLFFKVLYLKLNENSKFDRLFTLETGDSAIEHSKLDKEAFVQAVTTTDLVPLAGDSVITKAFNYFLANINPANYDMNVLRNCLNFVVIDLEENDDEQQIFDTINSLGVRLTTGELLKNHFFQRENYDYYEAVWKPVFEADNACISYWNDSVTTGRLKKANIEAFLYSYLQVKMHDPAFNVSFADRSVYRRSDGLFNSFKHFEQYYFTNSEELIKDIAEYAKIYKEKLNPEIKQYSLTGTPSLDRVNFMIYNLDVATLIPYVLYVLMNLEDEDEKKKIFEVLESYIMRRLVCNSKTGNYSDLFSENLIGNQILTADALKQYLQSKEPTSSLAIPSNTELEEGFTYNKMTNKRARGILYMLESRIRSCAFMATELLPFERYTLEHILPQKWTLEKWPLPEEVTMEQRNSKLQTLGNFTILPQPLNTSISNESWSNKLNGNNKNRGLREYATGLLTLQDYLSLPKWNEEDIQRRAQDLTEKAKRIWVIE